MQEPTLNIGKILTEYMWAKKIGLKELSKEMGINLTTLHRLTKGKTLNQENTLIIINWMFSQDK